MINFGDLCIRAYVVGTYLNDLCKAILVSTLDVFLSGGCMKFI